MKWFLIIATIVGSYYVLMMASANVVLQATSQLQGQYASAGATAQQIADGSTTSNR